MPEHEICQVIEKIALSCNPPFSLKEAMAKVKSAFDRKNRQYSNLAQEVREYILSINGQFLSRDVQNCLGLSNRRDQKNLSEILRVLVSEGIIERYGDKNGCFRRIDKTCEIIDWKNASTDPFSVNLPFGLNHLVQIMSKNLIVVAGSPDAGKTAFLLNVVLLNSKKHAGNIHYFSSEMGGNELKKRLNEFDNVDLKTWDTCIFKERSYSFSDVIEPDAINIIDFIEINKDFWLISQYLTDIHNKLKNGIAFVALQKNPGAEAGRGGTFGLEKPRLYLTIDKDYPNGHLIKIIKAKNWAHSVNPNGMTKSFKIVKGCNLIENGEWQRAAKG